MKREIFYPAVVAGVAGLLILRSRPKVKDSFTDVYHYFTEFDLAATHARIIETGFKDVCIGVQLYDIVNNSGNPPISIEGLLDEIRWAKSVARGNGSVGLFIYNDTTRVGYDADGVYRYYRSWDQRIPVMEAIARSGIDYFLFVSGETHFSSLDDITTFLLAQKSIVGKRGVPFGVYDGDGFRDMLNYGLLDSLGVSICSDIYMDWETGIAFLRSPAGWSYNHLITYCWLGIDRLIQNKQAIDAVRSLLTEQGYKGYNLLSTADYQGIMPDFALP